MFNRTIRRAAIAALLAGVTAPPSASAESVADFFKDRTITILTGTALGSAYGAHGLMFKEYFARYMPGQPNVIVTAMPGGGGAKMVNYLYNAAPQDGTVIGFPLKYIAVDQALGRDGIRYDARKFGYIGTLGPINSAVAVWTATAPATTLEGMRKTEVVMGATGRSSETFITPTLMNKLLGFKFKLVTGYTGMAPISLAMERGEIHGRAGSWDSIKSGHADWLAEKRIAIVAQSGLKRDQDLQDAPTLIDLAKDADSKAILEFFGNGNAVGWMMIAPPKLPAERLAAMRAAFDRTMADAKYRAETKAKQLDVAPMSGAEVEKIIHNTVNVTPAFIAKVKQALE